MKRAAIPVLLAASAAVSWPQQQESFDDVLEAMRAGLGRARTLSLPNHAPPYFVQYLARRTWSFFVTATLGALVSRVDNNVCSRPKSGCASAITA